MIGSLCGILAAFILFYNPVIVEKYEFLAPVLIGISLVFFLIESITFAIGLRPLQKSCQSMSPHLLNLFKKDTPMRVVTGWLFAFVFLTLLMTFYLPTFSNPNKNLSLGIWLILLGISFDSLKISQERLLNYLNPFSVLDFLRNNGIKNIQADREIDLCDSIDALTEAEVKAIQNKNPFLAIYGLNNTQNMCRIFLESSKSIGHENHDSQIQSLGIEDKVSFVLSHLFQRMDFVFQESLNHHLKIVLNSIITNMGKIIISSAKCDLTLTPNPILQLGKFAEKSINHNFSDVGVLASCTLLEVAKTIINDIDCTYLEIQDTFLCIIGQLENIAKISFKQDKNSKIAVLISPFLDLTELFKTEKNAAHQDTPVILKDLTRVIAEFQMLETVMRTIPPINPTTTS